MVCVRLPLTLLLICFHRSIAQLDPCDIYNEDFQCDGTSTSAKIPLTLVLKPLQNIDDCRDNPIKDTPKLIGERTLAIDTEFAKLNGTHEAIMVIGMPGVGKSTLTYFVAGNDSALIAYIYRDSENRIMDCNEKIGQSVIVVQTTIPEVVVEPDTTIAFLDYPGFVYTPTPPCTEIALSYSMINAAERLKRAKFIITVDYRMVSGNSYQGFIGTIIKVIDFIPGIKKLGAGIGLVATKVKQPGYTDLKIVSLIKGFLIEVLSGPSFAQMFPDPIYVEKAKFIINTIQNNGRIGILRVPDNCGPLSTIPIMVENKLALKYVTLINVNFVSVQPADFSYALSREAQLLVSQLRFNWTEEITRSLSIIAQKVSSFLDFDCIKFSSCQETIVIIDTLFADREFSKGYTNFDAFSNATISDIVHATTTVYFQFRGIQLPLNISKSLSESSSNLTLLEPMDNTRVDLLAMYEPLQYLHFNILKIVSNIRLSVQTRIVDSMKAFTESAFTELFPSEQCKDRQECDGFITSILRLLYSA